MKRSEPEFITIGQILAPWGLEGKVKVELATDFPERFAPRSTIYVNRQPMTIDGNEWHKGKVVVKLVTIDGIDQAEKLRGQAIEIPSTELHPLPEGQYYHFQLVGLKVWTTRGEFLGTITRVMTAESNDNYLVSGAGGEFLIPAIEDVVKSVDLDKGQVLIEAITGLLDLNQRAAG